MKKKPYTFHANRIWLHIRFSLSLAHSHTHTARTHLHGLYDCVFLPFVFYWIIEKGFIQTSIFRMLTLDEAALIVLLFFNYLAWPCECLWTNHGNGNRPIKAVIKNSKHWIQHGKRWWSYVNGMGQWTPIYKSHWMKRFSICYFFAPWCCCQWCWIEIQAAHKYLQFHSLPLSILAASEMSERVP